MPSRPYFVNLTPHPVTIHLDGKWLNINPGGEPARVEVEQKKIGEVAGMPIMLNSYGEITSLPDPKNGVIYIVSLIVRQALGESRPDVMAPDTGSTASRNDGRVIGVRQLVAACA